MSEAEPESSWKPRLRENVWYIDPSADLALLVTSGGRFEVPVADALSFLRLRSHCTGYVSIDDIARRAAVPAEHVADTIRALGEIGVVYPAAVNEPSALPSSRDVGTKLVHAARIWSEELRCTTVTRELAAGDLPLHVLVGWLLEQYHLLRWLPRGLALAARGAPAPAQSILQELAESRREHASAIGSALINLGLGELEVIRSAPLLSTRLLCFQMSEVLGYAPCSAVLLEVLRGAQTLDTEQIRTFRARIAEHPALSPDALEPWFELQVRDARLTATELLTKHVPLFERVEPADLDRLCNDLHDIRHAYDLLALEVKDYHGLLAGKYVPRQPVDFSSL